MVFDIKYDPSSNVKFVKCVEKYPIIYRFSNVSKPQKDKEWEKVAKELNSTVLFCRDRWTNLLGCYKRFLRHKAEKVMKKPYYLAEHMAFVRPFVNIKIGGSLKNGRDIEFNDEDDDRLTIEDINLADKNIKMEVCNDFPVNPVCILLDSSSDEETVFEPLTIASEGSVSSSKHEENEDNDEEEHDDYNDNENADLFFFKSLLPDIRLMTSQQQLKFRKELLNAIDMTLYGKELENIIIKTEVE